VRFRFPCCASTTSAAACLDGYLFPQQTCREQDEPFIRNTICRNKFVHQPMYVVQRIRGGLEGGMIHNLASTKVGLFAALKC
jgi:hypothetical protein